MTNGINRTYFREVQSFRQWWVWAVTLAPLAVFAYGFYVQIILGRPWGSKPMSDGELVAVTSALALVAVWIYLMRLVTEVRDDGLHIHFQLLWRRRVIPYGDILDAEAVAYNPLADYGGWGIRHGRRGWAYNVSGSRGVRLELTGDKSLLVGSQRADELAQAINARRAAVAGPWSA